MGFNEDEASQDNANRRENHQELFFFNRQACLLNSRLQIQSFALLSLLEAGQAIGDLLFLRGAVQDCRAGAR